MPAPTTVSITFGSKNWDSRAYAALNDGKRVKLTVKGPSAASGASAIKSQMGVQALTGIEVVAIAFTVIAVAGMAVVAAVCLYGISKGYCVYATHKAKGWSPVDDELTFDLKPNC